MKGHIIAFEGPAGSGKGWHMDQARALAGEGAAFLERPRLPRDLGAAVGAWSSAYLEFMAISAAVMMPEKTFYSDRFLLSRWVYKAIEDGGRLDRDFERKLEESWHRMCALAQCEAMARIGYRPWGRPDAEVIVLLPSLEGLVSRRRMAFARGREYPFSPELELRLYREALARAQDIVLPALSFRELVPAEVLV